MDKRRWIDQMLETENLTDDLEDADAAWLLDWGAQKLEEALGVAQNEAEAGSRANAIMAVMRKINRIAGYYRSKQVAGLAQDLSWLDALFSQAFPESNSLAGKSAEALEGAAATLKTLDTRQALEYLASRSFLPGAGSKPDDPPPPSEPPSPRSGRSAIKSL